LSEAVDDNRLAEREYAIGAAGKGMRSDCVAENTASAREVELRCGLRHDVLRSIVAEDEGAEVEFCRFPVECRFDPPKAECLQWRSQRLDGDLQASIHKSSSAMGPARAKVMNQPLRVENKPGSEP